MESALACPTIGSRISAESVTRPQDQRSRHAGRLALGEFELGLVAAAVTLVHPEARQLARLAGMQGLQTRFEVGRAVADTAAQHRSRVGLVLWEPGLERWESFADTVPPTGSVVVGYLL